MMHYAFITALLVSVLALADAAAIGNMGAILRRDSSVPYTPDVVRLDPPMNLPPGDWRVDDDPEAMRPGSGTLKGVTYLYKCGTESKGDFFADTCGDLMNPVRLVLQPCKDGNLNPYPSDKGGPRVCAALKNTGATAYSANGGVSQVVDIPPQMASNACGWLGGRCKGHWQDAMILIFGLGIRGKTVDFPATGLGAVKIYNS